MKFMTGLGATKATIKVYIENPPPLPYYQQLTSLVPMKNGEIKSIADLTGNHWRKIFNVYAKLCHQIAPDLATSWQTFRDNQLLQGNSQQALIFTAPIFSDIDPENNSKNINIIMGRTYAAKTGIAEHCYWLSPEFAINETKRIIISPYFDYRQLSNIKLVQLAALITNFTAKAQ